MSLLSDLIGSLLEMPGTLGEVATTNPVSGVLMAFGALFLVLSLGYVAILLLGVIGNLVRPAGRGRVYPRGR
ncbi:MAG: hypothetical protein V5A43_03645 [Haloarculaceae archaeon]